MAKKKLSVDELLRCACIYAELDREGFVAAHDNMPNDPAAVKARAFLEELRAYRIKRWGKTDLEVIFEETKPVTVEESARGENRTFKVTKKKSRKL